MSQAPSTIRTSQRFGTVRPSVDEVRTWWQQSGSSARTVPVFREIMADVETPVSAYLKIAGDTPGFILESVEGGERIARYSFIGSGPLLDITFANGESSVVSSRGTEVHAYTDPLVELARILEPFNGDAVPGFGLPRFTGGAVGYLSYDSIRAFEPRVELAPGVGLGLPDGRYMLVDSLLVFDHIERTIKVVSHVHLGEDTDVEQPYADASERIATLVKRLRGPLPALPHGETFVDSLPAERATPNTLPEQYMAMVDRAKAYITAGDIFQVVLSQRVDVQTPVDPFTIYRALRAVNPSPYMFFLDFLDHHIVGASPELLVRLEDGVITNHPIAGTRPRGETPAADDALAVELLADQKEVAEHIMLVDLGRNDVGRVSKPGTVRVPRLMEIERFSHVMHIVSHVEGDIVPDQSGLDALRACFPAGTVSGAPKVRAMEIIAEMEPDRRGAYSGAVGYVDFSGGMDTCIALRTLIVKDGVASMQAGAGIVADSVPATEHAECHHKMRALLRAIELAEALEAAEASEGMQP